MDALEGAIPSRKLVSVRRIARIKPLDALRQVVVVGGWPVVVPRSHSFAVQQLVLYFEIDSFLPFDEERYEPYRLSQTSAKLHGQKGWVVQTVKLGGHVSQGMVFSIDYKFPEVIRIKKSLRSKSDDGADCDDELMSLDLTDDLKIKKWATFYPFDGGVDLGDPPSFLPNTELELAQNLHWIWEKYGDTEFQITELLDGMPMMLYQVREDEPEYMELPGMLKDDKLFRKRPAYGISVWNHDLGETQESMTWVTVRDQGIIEAMAFQMPLSQLVLAGVLHGEEITGNPQDIDGWRFSVHGIFGIGNSTWRQSMKQAEGTRDTLGETFELVPTFSRRVKLSAFAEDIDDLMMKAEGDSCVFKNEHLPPKRKGLVFDALDGSLSFKAVSNGWLLDETDKLREDDEDDRQRPGPNDWF